MGTGLRVRATDLIDKNVSFETVAGSFPARFGRSHQCEVILQRSFVSGVHAVVDLRDGKLLLRDMGSRNRIRLGDKDAPLESNAEVDLAPYGSTFTIGSLQLRVSVEEFAEPADAVSMAMSMVTGKPLETVCNPYAASVARGAESEALARQVEAPFAAYRAQWDGFFKSLREHVESLPPSIRRDVLAGASARFPAATREPEFQALLKENGVATGAAAAAPARDADHASHALEELRTLARWFLDLPLETAEDISGFSLRLRDTLAEFLRGVIPTRDGIRSVASSLSSGGPAAADELESARTDAEVADALLNWKNRTQPKVVVKRLVTNIHIHQVGLVSGVFEGVRVLLESLSPAKIRAEFETGPAPAGGTPTRARKVWAWSYGALWRAFEVKHADFASEEGSTFRVIFGPEFDFVYRKQFEDLAAAEQPEIVTATAAPQATPVTHGTYPNPNAGPMGTVVIPRTPPPRNPDSLPNGAPAAPGEKPAGSTEED